MDLQDIVVELFIIHPFHLILLEVAGRVIVPLVASQFQVLFQGFRYVVFYLTDPNPWYYFIGKHFIIYFNEWNELGIKTQILYLFSFSRASILSYILALDNLKNSPELAFIQFMSKKLEKHGISPESQTGICRTIQNELKKNNVEIQQVIFISRHNYYWGP